MYWDSDIGKWIETARYTLALHPDGALDARIDDVVARIAKAQEPDGYFNSFFQRREPDKKWTNLRDWHELYCAGHMIEGAVAHARATGKDNLLSIVLRQVDHIAKVFGTGPGQKRGYCGHPEIELALVKLHRLTGDRRPHDQAAVRHRRARPGGDQRGLHDRVRSAQRDRLRRDLRRGRPGVLGAPHGLARARRALRRRHGAGALQRRAERPVARRRALFL